MGFIDESAHTGSNYLDPSQPLFVVAAAVVPSSYATAVEAVVRAAEAEYPGSREVKGKTLVGSFKGRRVLADAISGAMKAGAFPVFQIWEKRYCVAAKLVETFFDPFHNEQCRVSTYANEDRQDLAQLMLDLLTPEALAEFLAAYRTPSEVAFRACIENTARALDAHSRPELSIQVRGNLPVVRKLVEAESATDGVLTHDVLTTLNLPAFFSLLSAVDIAADSLGCTLDLTHDETSQFAPAFHSVFTRMSQAPREESAPLQNGSVFRSGLSATKSFQFGKSVNTLGLRLADFLAAGVRAVIQAEMGLTSRCRHLDSLGEAIMPMLLMRPQLSMLVGSKDLLAAAVGAAVRGLKNAGSLGQTPDPRSRSRDAP